METRIFSSGKVFFEEIAVVSLKKNNEVWRKRLLKFPVVSPLSKFL